MNEPLKFFGFASFEDIKSAALALAPVGSKMTCVPAPSDTDEDWLVLLDKESLVWSLLDAHWQHDGSNIYDEINWNDLDWIFHSYSSHGVNIIATASKEFYRRFMAASSVAKRLNLLVKSDRFALFQAVLYGNEDEAYSLQTTK